jgi:serine/threonine-protein kinase
MFAGYRIDGVLDRGGMGVVYKATDADLDRTVALKIIAPEHTRNEDAVTRFKSEARLAASLEHPNIVPIHRGGEFEGVLYLAMRLVPGTNLREVINRGPLPVERVGRIVTQIADALEAAHDRGLVHRDVKPANVLVTGEGRNEHIYLTDFGLTKRLGSQGSLTQTGTWVGTPDYVAPEQIQGGSVDGRTDIYSLGCVLYEMLTGSVAFPRDNDVAKLWAHVSDAPPPPSMKRPDLVPAFDQIVARATAKSPEQRYSKPSELAAAVQEAVFEQNPQASGAGTQASAPPPTRLGSAGGFAAGAGAAAAGAAAAGSGGDAPAPSGHDLFVGQPTQGSGEQPPASSAPPPQASAPPPQGSAPPPQSPAPQASAGPPPPAAPPPQSPPVDRGGDSPGGPERKRRRWPIVAGIAALLCVIAVVAVVAGSGGGSSEKKTASGLPAKLDPVPTNRVNGNGKATIALKGNVATVTLTARGLLNHAPHAMHIHGGAKGQCPPASAAGIHNGNRAMSTTDGGDYYGHARAALTTRGDTTANSILAFGRFPASGNITYRRTFKLTPKALSVIRKHTAVIVVHGIDYNRNGIQDGTLDRSELNPAVQGETTAPALCGPVQSQGTRAQLPGGRQVYTAALTIFGSGPRWLCTL